MFSTSSAVASQMSKASSSTRTDQPPRRMTNRRQQRLGYLLFDGQRSSVPCAVHEFSTRGAVLAASGWMGLPETFMLYVEPDCVRLTCRVTSKKGSTVRVEFEEWKEAASMRRR